MPQALPSDFGAARADEFLWKVKAAKADVRRLLRLEPVGPMRALAITSAI